MFAKSFSSVVIVNSEDAKGLFAAFLEKMLMGNKKSPIDSKTKNNFLIFCMY
jgi:hypothetical protein